FYTKPPILVRRSGVCLCVGENPKHAMHGFSAQGCWRAAPAIPKCRRSAQKIYLASLGSCIESASEEWKTIAIPPVAS
ncbi:hypothetical protein, partial [Stutzerimonas nitrititolerans]|uniref:hypothetical protein n=1 Tax=Stutzerimonas nitrititolerans TaxID=2482751 RepID=UPI0028B20565